jgi:hypothetical protein
MGTNIILDDTLKYGENMALKIIKEKSNVTY